MSARPNLVVGMLALVVWLPIVGRGSAAEPGAKRAAAWQEPVTELIPAYGHRNWIVIADAAYPAQSRSGIQTIVTDADQLEVSSFVLAKLAGCRHVRPAIYLDAELPMVEDADAPGIDKYRQQLKEMLAGRKITSLPHERIIDRLDKAGEKFSVLILKTNMALPYTSIFLQLECGYWSDDAEKRLRAKMPPNSNEP
jgi:hypothetical protein